MTINPLVMAPSIEWFFFVWYSERKVRHLNSGRKFNRTSSHRRAMFRNMVVALFKHGTIETTDAKAKELRGVAEKLITLAKRGDLHARRLAFRDVRDRSVLNTLFSDIAKRFQSRNGGYTRVTKVRVRRGDAAVCSFVELLPSDSGVIAD